MLGAVDAALSRTQVALAEMGRGLMLFRLGLGRAQRHVPRDVRLIEEKGRSEVEGSGLLFAWSLPLGAMAATCGDGCRDWDGGPGAVAEDGERRDGGCLAGAPNEGPCWVHGSIISRIQALGLIFSFFFSLLGGIRMKKLKGLYVIGNATEVLLKLPGKIRKD